MVACGFNPGPGMESMSPVFGRWILSHCATSVGHNNEIFKILPTGRQALRIFKNINIRV